MIVEANKVAHNMKKIILTCFSVLHSTCDIVLQTMFKVDPERSF